MIFPAFMTTDAQIGYLY